MSAAHAFDEEEDTEVDAVVQVVEDTIPPVEPRAVTVRLARARTATAPLGSRCSRVVARIGA